jgi:hypothetical protein
VKQATSGFFFPTTIGAKIGEDLPLDHEIDIVSDKGMKTPRRLHLLDSPSAFQV